MQVRGSAAIVTGGASGLGAATARQLGASGAHVVVVDLNEDLGASVAGEVDGVYIPADVTNTDQVRAAVDAAVKLGPLRLLVNSAGVGWVGRTISRDGTFESAHDLEAFVRIVTVNLVGTFNMVRMAATAMSRTPALADGERGSIVNVASVAAFDGQTGQAAYSASKGAIVAMTLPLARDLAVVGVRVNTIAPGMVETPIYGHGDRASLVKSKLLQDALFPKRMGRAEEFASLAMELLTNSYINGETIRLDAGARMRAK
jgi:NAD(P)-dependent dehydrogenase (short-subunit alcohol dehydrogenase family)